MATKLRKPSPSPDYLVELVKNSLKAPLSLARHQNQTIHILLTNEALSVKYESSTNTLSRDPAGYSRYEHGPEQFIRGRKQDAFIPLTDNLASLLEFHSFNRSIEGNPVPTCSGIFRVALYHS